MSKNTKKIRKCICPPEWVAVNCPIHKQPKCINDHGCEKAPFICTLCGETHYPKPQECICFCHRNMESYPFDCLHCVRKSSPIGWAERFYKYFKIPGAYQGDIYLEAERVERFIASELSQQKQSYIEKVKSLTETFKVSTYTGKGWSQIKEDKPATEWGKKAVKMVIKLLEEE